MARYTKGKTHRPGSLHWRKGIRNLPEIIQDVENGDRLIFPSRIYEVKEQINVHRDVLFQGGGNAIVLIPNDEQNTKGFTHPGFLLTGGQNIHFKQLVFEVEPEVNAIDITSDFNGTVTLEQIETRSKRRVLYKDDRKAYPAIRVHGSGTLRIIRSVLNYVAIDAPNMIVEIEESMIGSFDDSSLIRAKEIRQTNSTINNCQISTPNGSHADLRTNGGLAFSGQQSLVRTHLEPLNAARPALYPKALTYIVTLPNTTLTIEDIRSTLPIKPPFYRHFEFRQSQVQLKGTTGLVDQLLDNILIQSRVMTKGGNWIVDPTAAEYAIQTQKLEQAHSKGMTA